MREQIRLWFYSQLFMSVTLTGKTPYRRVLGYEKLNDETGRAMHKSWGNAIWFDDAAERMGADVMRWLFAAQPPKENMNFGYGPAGQVKRRLLTLWNTYRFLVQNANPEGWRPDWETARRGPRASHALDRWIVARGQELARDAAAALDAYDTPAYARACESFWDDLSNWYVRRSRRRFWRGDRDAFATLHHALVQLARVLAPAMPFLADELWENLVARPCGDAAPASVHLMRYPEPDAELLDETLLAGMADVRAVVELGLSARGQAKIKVRQPLAAVVVSSADPARLAPVEQLAEEIGAELNVKRVEVTPDAERLVERQIVPNFRLLGPRLGGAVQEIRRLLQGGGYAPDAEGRVAVDGHVLEPGEYELRTRPREGFEAIDDGTFVVAVDTVLTDELVLEGVARDLVRHLQNVRKELGLDVSDRIRVRYAASGKAQEALARHRDWIAGEILAVELASGDGGAHPFALDGAAASFEIARA
jgi:isoleucyl-tRNA synthetase